MMGGSAGEGAWRSKPAFRRIAGKPGGARGAVLSAEVLAKAEARLKEMEPAVAAEIAHRIAAIRRMATDMTSERTLFDAAHDVRGVAGTFGFEGVGVICGGLCDYGQDLPPDATPDWRLIQSLAAMMGSIFAEPGQLSIAEVRRYTREAVQKTMTREGRTPGRPAQG